MDLPFSIYSELWQDAWIAATSAIKSRKRQTDLSVKQRVERLLQDYGPDTARQLTLRVYGTMLKGFCVINNDRARSLFSDCERVVVLFAQQPFTEEAAGIKLPAAKRHRIDALTLDLDLAKVQDFEAFDWTQAPLGDEALLGLTGTQEAELGAMQEPNLVLGPSLLEEAGLLDEAFPGLDAPATAAAEAAVLAGLSLEMGHEGQDGAMDVDFQAPLALGGWPQAAEAAGAEQLQVAAPKRRRILRLPKPPVPGVVFGFDEEAQLPAQDFEAQELEARCAQLGLRRDPTAFAELAAGDGPLERLGALRPLMDPPLSDFKAARGGAFLPEFIVGRAAADAARRDFFDDAASEAPSFPPEIQGLLRDEARPDMLGAIFAEPPEGPAFRRVEMQVEESRGSRALRAGSVSELAEVFGPSPLEDLSAAEVRAQDEEAAYDLQTGQVAFIIRRCITNRGAADSPLTFAELLPANLTERATAARTFSSLLTLATAGDLSVMQSVPFGPIAISTA